ncbi:hypothetical protein [Streptomyces sp. A5-4]|uniref:hypothetical protein n=1 Tax=Streptomyces sp. A5-4 TaxID=3384771 RepID=UPI003DAA40BE
MSYNQPGPYGGQPQQPGPYGQQPQYGGGQFPPPAPAAPKKKTGLIVGVVVVALAVIGGGAYFLVGPGGSGGLEDDGPHKLTTPATVLGEYKRLSGDSVGKTPNAETKQKFTDMGVEDGHPATGIYSTTDLTKFDPKNPSSLEDAKDSKSLNLFGAWGKISDPEKAVDAYFANTKREAEKESEKTKVTLVGEPEEVSPDGFDGGIMKCQAMESKNPTTGQAQTSSFCAWSDYSTMGVVASNSAAKPTSTEEAANITAKLRTEIRVKQ